MSLPEGWESDYDGTRWLFRYKATGTVQYHFPQPGDEYAEFLLDAGMGPIRLSPEERLVIEQHAKRQSISGGDIHGARNGPTSSGSKIEKKKAEDEFGMSATGYFDPMDFSGGFNSASPLGEDDPEEAVELPGNSQQMRSPVGFIAELATQETVKCAEELAPVELDGTTLTPPPFQTNTAQEPVELPTHRSPVDEKPLIHQPYQPATQLVDPSALTSASFSYSGVNPSVNSNQGIPLRASSIRRKPLLSNTSPVSFEQNKYQPWKPTQGIAEYPSQGQNGATEALLQTSVLQHQNSELGIVGQNTSGDGSLVPGGIPNSLKPSSAPSKPAFAVSSPLNSDISPVRPVLQPAHGPTKQSVSPETTNYQLMLATQVTHSNVGSSYTPPMFKPGGPQLNNSNNNLEGSGGNPVFIPPPPYNPQHNVLSQHKPDHTVQVSSGHCDQPGVTKPNPLANNAGHAENSPKPPSGSYSSDIGRVDSQTPIHVDEQIPAVASLNFIKRHSSKSSQVSSIIAEPQDSNPQSSNAASPPSDDISEVISMVSSFTPQATPAPSADTKKPEPGLIGGGEAKQKVNGPFPPPIMNMHQPNEPSSPAAVNTSKPVSTDAVAETSPPGKLVNGATQSGPKMQAIYYPPPPVSGPSIQNQNLFLSSPPCNGNPGTVSTSPRPLGFQGNPSKPILPQPSSTPVPSPLSSQANNILHTRPPPVLGAQSTYANNTIQRPPQCQQPIGQNTNGASQIPATTPVPHTACRPQGQVNSTPNPIVGPSTIGQSQVATHKPTLQHPVVAGSLNHQPGTRPPVGHQTPGSVAAQNTAQATYQQPSPVTHSVSPLQSQVSSPAQSIASLHISPSSTPSTTFATMNNTTNSHSGPIINANQTTAIPVRPSSMLAHPPSQQVGTTMPPINSHHVPASAAGKPNAQTLPTTSSPAKPYPMLPGQVTPLPSQIGSFPIPPPPPLPVHNNQAKPMFSTPSSTVGQQQAHMPAAPAGQPTIPGQMNPMQNLPTGHVPSGPVLPQAQMKPPQQQVPLSHPGASHVGGHQAFPSNPPQTLQQLTSYPATVAPSQAYIPQAPVPPPPASAPVNSQNAFPPPPAASVTSSQEKPFNSSQAGVALSDAGKVMRKWGKKMFQSPAIKQTTVAISGAILAESVGVNAGAGAQLANNIYTTATRPPLAHAQTAPPGTTPQQQSVQMGQQQASGKILSLPMQQSQHLQQSQPGQLGQPKPPQPGHPSLAQPAHLPHPQPPGHTRPLQPGQINSTQLGYLHVGRPQLTGAQIPGRPPVVQIQNPALQAGMAVNINAQAQAQTGFYQRPQYPPMNPVMASGVRPTAGPPGVPANGQPIIDPMTANAVATIVGSAIGSASRPGHSQPQNTNASTQGYAQQDYASHPGPGSAEHGAGAHEQAYHQTAPGQTPAYADNSYVTDRTCTDNSSYAVNNTYAENTDVVNNTIVIDNSTTVLADTTYNNASYADASSFNNTDITASIATDIDTNSAIYTDSNMTTFGMDESFSVAATSEVAATSVDYSGGSWGDFFS